MNNTPCENCGWDPSKRAVWSWEVTLDFEYLSGNKVPPNDRGRSGWKYRNYRKEFERQLRKVVEAEKLREAKVYRRATICRLWGKHQSAYDTDNLVAGGKPLRDILVRCRLLVDDRPSCCDIYYQQYKNLVSDKPQTIVKVEEF